MQAELAIKNPLNAELDALQLETQLTLELVPVLQPLGLTLTASLKNFALKVTGVRALYKQDKLSVERVDTTINAFLENLKKAANEVLEKQGLKLPMPEFLQLDKYSKNHGFEARDGYYVIKADAKIETDDDDDELSIKHSTFLQ